MLDEDPRGVSVDGLLQAELASEELVVELVKGNAVQERNLLGDLVDGLVKGREVAIQVHSRTKVDGHDGDAVSELLNVLPGARDAVVVVQVREGREHATGCASAESNDETLLSDALDIEDLDNGTGPVDGEFDDLLVDLLGVLGGLLPEAVVGDDLETSLLGVRLLRLLLEQTLVNEVAAKTCLGRRAVANDSRRTEGLNTVLGLALVVEVLGLEALLIPGTANAGPASFTGVDINGVVTGLHVQTDLLLGILTHRCGYLGSVEGSDLVGNNCGRLNLEVDVVNAKLLVEPVNLVLDNSLGKPSVLLNDFLD